MKNAHQVIQSLSPEWLGLSGWDCDCIYDHVVKQFITVSTVDRGGRFEFQN